tara:strand:+ start:515 stop:706 length:192 start_codon:yes stop_codon:yes gene_type:complete
LSRAAVVEGGGVPLKNIASAPAPAGAARDAMIGVLLALLLLLLPARLSRALGSTRLRNNVRIR